MKKFFLTLPFWAAITLVSCEKQNINSSKPLKNSVNSEKTIADSEWYDDGTPNGVEGTNFGCHGSPVDCLPNVTVTPSLGTVLTNFGTSSTPGSYASSNYGTLKTVIDSDLLDNVIAGTNTVYFRGHIASGTTGYLIFSDASGVLVAYRFSL